MESDVRVGLAVLRCRRRILDAQRLEVSADHQPSPPRTAPHPPDTRTPFHISSPPLLIEGKARCDAAPRPRGEDPEAAPRRRYRSGGRDGALGVNADIANRPQPRPARRTRAERECGAGRAACETSR
ncbi:unnamed protein product [Danaus chrysippus]|uniref:(African queen) hypothetical protein n=1 Tax=Danaus chrysippus TaxID=151541 RepID=A0A8J2WBR7_9NEOP|nr:unnamed protein product [Danaus chrysippus]